MKNYKLPQGWVECQLEDILSNEKYSIKRGPFGSSLKKTFFVPSGIRVFEQYNPINNDPYWSRYYITESKYQELEAFTAKAGDFLVSCSGTLGKILQLPVDVEKGIINQALLKITVNNDVINSGFFIKLFQSPKFQKNILDNTIGTAIQNIASVKELKKIRILLPPLNEQKRIVEKIESEFAKIDEGLEHLEHAKEQIKQYRQYVLKSAFDGKLHKTSVWKETTLNECTSKLGDGLHGTPKYSDDGDFYFINGNNLNDGIIEIKKDTKKVNFEEYQKYKKELNNNTVLVSINGTIGNTAFYNNEKVILGKSACYFNLINNVDKYFIRYLLKTNYFLNYANKNATGSTIKNVSLKIMREFNFKLPLTLDEQKKIVEEIEKRFAVADEVEKVVEQNIEKSKQLKQSILKKAFEGRLVPQDPTDEPASILLEKIKQERSKKK